MNSDHLYQKYQKYKIKYNSVKHSQIGGAPPKLLKDHLNDIFTTNLYIYKYAGSADSSNGKTKETYKFVKEINNADIAAYLNNVKSDPLLGTYYYYTTSNTSEVTFIS